MERLIWEQLHQAVVVEIEPAPHPEDASKVFRRFNLDIPRFEGPNGNVANVLTAWALDPGSEVPHLTNAYPKSTPEERATRWRRRSGRAPAPHPVESREDE